MPQLVAPEKPRDHPVEPSHRPAPDRERGVPEAQEIPPLVDVPVHEAVEPDPIELGGSGEKAEEPGAGARLHAFHLLEHRVEPAGHVERTTVGVVYPIVRIELHQVQIGLERATHVAEQGVEVLDHEQEGRTGVEAETFRLPEAAAAAGHRVTLQHGDFVAPVAKPYGRGEPAQPGADHQDVTAAGSIRPGRTRRR